MTQMERMLQRKTGSFLSALYMHDISEAVHVMDINIIFAGPGGEAVYSGMDQVLDYLESIGGKSKDTILDMDYQCISLEQDVGIVSMKYTVSRQEYRDICVMHMLVFWSKGRGGWKIVHVHLNDINAEEEKIVIQGEHGSIYMLYAREILFIEARNMYSDVHCSDQIITAHEQLSALWERLPQNFVKIHRSYLVNACCIESIERYEVKLKNGNILPVPEKKYKDVEEKIKPFISKKDITDDRNRKPGEVRYADNKESDATKPYKTEKVSG